MHTYLDLFGPFEFMLFAWFYLTSSVVVAFVASQKGRSGARWLIASLFLSPWILLLALCAIPSSDVETASTRPSWMSSSG